jgi:hypothetical protein
MPATAPSPFTSAGAPAPAPPPRGALERLPKWLICVPLALQWLWLGLRHRSLTLPTAANPRITAGGLVGEGKLEYFAGMARSRVRRPPGTARSSTALMRVPRRCARSWRARDSRIR